MKANHEQIDLLCKKFEPIICACSEARITNEMMNSEYNIDGYNAIECFSQSRNTGGVIMYIRNECSFKIIRNENVLNILWCLTIEMIEPYRGYLFSVFYISPNKNIKKKTAIKNFDDLLESIVNLNKVNVIMGDLNFDISKSNPNTTKILNN